MHPRSPEVTKRDARPPRARQNRRDGQDRQPPTPARMRGDRRSHACAVGAQKAGPLGFPQTRTHACPASQQCHPRARPQEAERVSRDLRDNAQSGRAPTAGRPGARRQGEGEQTVAPSCRGAGLGDKKGQATNAYGISKPKERPLDGETHGDVPLTRTLRPAAGLTGSRGRRGAARRHLPGRRRCSPSSRGWRQARAETNRRAHMG